MINPIAKGANRSGNSSPIDSAGIFQKQDFKGFMSSQARRFAEFSGVQPESDIAVPQWKNDIPGTITKTGKELFEEAMKNLESRIQDTVLQKTKSLNFMDELEKAEEEKGKQEAPKTDAENMSDRKTNASSDGTAKAPGNAASSDAAAGAGPATA